MTYPNTIENQIQQILLEKVRFNIANKISRYDLNFDHNIDMYADHISDSFIYNMKMNIFGEKHLEEIKYPKTWFQMFKRDWFPKWLLKKFPVQNQTLGILELYQLYPHIKSKFPEERHYIHLLNFEKGYSSERVQASKSKRSNRRTKTVKP